MFDHLEFVFLDAHVNVRFVEVLPFLPGRDDHDLGFFNIDDHPIFITPIGYFLFSFSSISCTFFPQALMVESSAYISTLLIVLVLIGMSFINTK